MAYLEPRAAASTQLSTTAIVAIVTGIGVVMLCLLTALVVLLIRAIRRHKQLLADLDERGVSIAQAQKDARRESVTRPRAVLRRNTILPFNKTSGWNTLPSVETIRSAESTNLPAHYVPPMPAEGVKRASRLSWPFSARRLSGHAVQMKKIKVSRLSTVIESPKQSPLASVLSNSHSNTSRPSVVLSGGYASKLPSCQPLLQYHPAFRNQNQDTGFTGLDARVLARSSIQADASRRPQRAKSIAEVPVSHLIRPEVRARSASLCNQTSGQVPDVILPPLPLDIDRIKDESRRHSQLKHAPSKSSISSFGSADTAILASRPSSVVPQVPQVPQSTKFRGQKITKPNAKGSSFAREKSLRDTLELRPRVRGTQTPVQPDISRMSTAASELREMPMENRDTLPASLSTQLRGTANGAQPITSNKLTSPMASPRTVQNMNTPKRRSKTQVSSAGSPERQCQNSTNPRSLTGVIRSPKRQHSQTSSRSSGGNPFQWDPTPLSPTGKPSALKGSPSARQGHPRKNSVRISLVPTVHGPPSRPPSETLLNNDKSDTIGGASTSKPNGLGLGFSNTQSLPTPPSSSTFEPDLRLTATPLRASLTLTSPTLPLVGYDQSFVVFPTDQILPQLSEREQKRLSNGSIFSLSRFPTAPSVIEAVDVDTPRPLSFHSSQNYDFDGNWMPNTPILQQTPFRVERPDQDQSPSTSIDEYYLEQPSGVYQTPTNTNSRAFQSAFATIPEESSVSPNKTVDVQLSRYDDSPSVSPKTMSPPRFTLEDRSAYNLPVGATAIPEEPLDTIDPSILSKDAFNLLTSSYKIFDDSIFQTDRLSIAIPTTSGSAQSMLKPFLENAFPSSFPSASNNDSPTIGHARSEQSSSTSSPSLSPTASPIELPSPIFPCSPRPGHAQLPTSSLLINFAELPKLAPSLHEPRGSPSRPLRSSIAALRRMNSDATDAKNAKSGRGERRYLSLGREDSVQVSGDESWLDDLEDDDDDTVTLDDEEGRRLVGNLLEGWEDEGYAMLDFDEGNTMDSCSTIKPERELKTEPKVDVVEEDTTAGAEHPASSIWDDGDNFWTSPTSPSSALGSPNKPKPQYQPLASSPLATPTLPAPSTPKSASRKRHFEVAKDDIPNQEDNQSSKPRNKRRDSNGRRQGTIESSRYRKRGALSNGTPNVKIQITSPGGHVVANGTPGSLYDLQGFLR